MDPARQVFIGYVPDVSQKFIDRESLLASARAIGPESLVMEQVMGSKARADAEALVAKADDIREQKELMERQEERRQAKAFADNIRKINDTMDKLNTRIDAFVAAKDQRERAERAQQIKEAMLALPDEDEPYCVDPAEKRYGKHPPTVDADESELPSDIAGYQATNPARKVGDGRSGMLPTALEMPATGGDLPVNDPAELSHPQPSQQTQTAIGGS
jgi:hypothetical protein